MIQKESCGNAGILDEEMGIVDRPDVIPGYQQRSGGSNDPIVGSAPVDQQGYL